MDKTIQNQPGLNYHHLFYFMTIALEGGVAKAAQKLRLGQSTLSTQLGQLEHHLGIVLFERQQKRLHLTAAGKIALDYAQGIFRLGDELLDALHDRKQDHRLRVQLGVSDSIPKAIVLDLLATAEAFRPCAFSVVEGVGHDLLSALSAHELDLILLNHALPVGRQSGLYARLAARTPVVVMGGKQFKSLRRHFPESLAGQAFIMPGIHSRLRHDVDAYFKLRKIPVDIVFELQDASLQLPLAMKGSGLIPVAQHAAYRGLTGDELIEIGPLEGVYEELWLIGAQRRLENPVAAHLLKAFKV